MSWVSVPLSRTTTSAASMLTISIVPDLKEPSPHGEPEQGGGAGSPRGRAGENGEPQRRSGERRSGAAERVVDAADVDLEGACLLELHHELPASMPASSTVPWRKPPLPRAEQSF
jgi:hypothetical protein